jgi:hypothetical protein
MKRSFLAVLAGCALIGAVALSSSQKPSSAGNGDLQIQIEERNPWTHLRVNQAPDIFHFAVVSDRTGGHRPRIFSQAVEQLNLLQPAFVISVGDLIEGYSKEPEKIDGQWREMQSYAHKLQMPFFYAPGNHDVANPYQEQDWKNRFGRCYYHFVYKDVLFLMLCTDDPAPAKEGGMSKEQVAFVQKVLKENDQVRWTIVSVHRPLWDQKNIATNGWLDVEKSLQGRTYTVFAGHIHRYHKFVRQGMNYYQLATTGGGSRMRGVRYGEFDHFVWVTMKKDGPVLANLLLDGIYPEDMKTYVSNEEGVPTTNRKPVHPVRGKIFYEGAPIADARIAFHLIDGKDGKKYLRGGDAIVDAAPAGEYAVTVLWREPWLDAQGRPGNNLIPVKYHRPETSGLRVQVKTGTNELTLNLTK